MAIQYGAVSVGTVATLILTSNPNRRGALILNNGVNTIYLGFDSNVTAATGMPLVQNGTYNDAGDDVLYRSDLWGITSQGNSDIRFEEWEP